MDKRFKKTLILRITKAFHVLAVTALFCLCWMQYYGEETGVLAHSGYTIAAGVMFFAFIILIGRVYDIYAVGSARVTHLI